MFKLLALDMDGTVLNDQLVISDENTWWLNRAREAGVTVMFSTGRGYDKMIDYANLLKLDSPIITVNGSEVWLKPGQLLHRTLLEADLVERLYHLAQKYKEAWFWAYSTEQIYNKENWSTLTQSIQEHQWLKFGYYMEDLHIINEIKQEIASWGLLEISNSSPYNIELNALDVSKASALSKLCKHIGLQMSEVIAIGDSLNDIKAIKECGLGVAMANAQEEVKAAADYVTLSNNEHGVAHVIKKFIFNE